MLNIKVTAKFKKDVKRCNKQGLPITQLKLVIHELEQNHSLPSSFKNHALDGNYSNYLECHIKPDWLLIYQVNQTTLALIRTGSHAELFKK